MLEIPVIRWGKPYESLEKADVVHFETGEVMAKMHQANAGLVQMDSRKSAKAREILKQFTCAELIKKCEQAADLYLTANLPMGTGTQTPEEFCSIQSATTGLPLNMCRANMTKNAFVLKHMGDMLDSLTRGLPLDIRHITFSTANLAYGAVGLDFAMSAGLWLHCILGVALIGIINLTVSFALALWTALRAHGVRISHAGALLRHVGTQFARSPMQFFYPPGTTADGKP